MTYGLLCLDIARYIQSAGFENLMGLFTVKPCQSP